MHLWIHIFVFAADVYDVRKEVIGSVTPQRPGLFAQMYPSTFFQDSTRHTHTAGKNKQIRICHHHLGYTPCRTFVYTHTTHTHTHTQPASERHYLRLKLSRLWKTRQNGREEKTRKWRNRAFLSDRGDGLIGGEQEKRTKAARKVKTSATPTLPHRGSSSKCVHDGDVGGVMWLWPEFGQ